MIQHEQRFMPGLFPQQLLINPGPHVRREKMPPNVKGIRLRRLVTHAGCHQGAPEIIKQEPLLYRLVSF
jgi:hypothetical protein